MIDVIVIDDASDDNTCEVVARIIAGNTSGKQIEYHRLQSPSGACAARNAAVARARGELITGLDDDDYFAVDRVATLVSVFDPAVHSFVFDGYVRETIGPEGRVGRTSVRLPRHVNLSDLLRRNVVGNQVLTQTQRLRDVGAFDERLPAWQDYDLWIRLVRAYGTAKSANGFSYHCVSDKRIGRISDDPNRIRRALELFVEKHPEYSDARLRACLALGKACYGTDPLTLSDVGQIARLGNGRLVISAAYFFARNRLATM